MGNNETALIYRGRTDDGRHFYSLPTWDKRDKSIIEVYLDSDTLSESRYQLYGDGIVSDEFFIPEVSLRAKYI